MSYKKVLLVSIPVQDVTRPPAAIPILAACCEQVCAEYQSLDLNLHMHKTLPQSIVNSVKSDFILGIISAETENNFAKIYDFLDEQIDFFEPDLLAISIFTYESIPAGMLLLKHLNQRSDRKNFAVVLGGLGVESHGKDLFAEPTFKDWVCKSKQAEYVICGEGELSFVELLRGNINYPGINEIPPQQITDLDSLPSPSYQKINLGDYFYSSTPEVVLTGSRGCVRDCSFCDVGYYWKKYIYRDGANIANDLFSIWQQTKVTKFFFSDSLINGSLRSFRALNRELIELQRRHPDFQPEYSGQFICRPIGQMKYQDYVEMKLAGAKNLIIGIEHFSHHIRQHMGKDFDNAAVDWHFETCAELGLQNTLLLLSGYLTETQEDHKTNLEYLEKYQVFALGPVITAVNLNISGLVIYKGAPLYNILHNEYPEQDYNSKFWTYPKNPTLTLNERVRRATELTYTATRLGFNILHFESRINELRQLQHMLKETTQQKILPIFPLYNTHEHIG